MEYSRINISWCFWIVFSSWTSAQFLCPQSSWAKYKNQSVSSSLFVADPPVKGFSLNKRIDYHCNNNNNLTLKTTYFISDLDMDWNCAASGNIQCTQNCKPNANRVTILVKCNRVTLSDSWSGYTVQTIKDCDFLFWSSWSPTRNCSSSRSGSYMRKCVDCDYDEVNSTYCQGSSIKTVPCPPSGSAWENIGDCKRIRAHETMGEQRRKRNCMYEDRSITHNTSLCSNESATSTSYCDITFTTGTNNTVSSDEYKSILIVIIGLGIGLVLAIVVGLCFYINLKRRSRNKQQTSHCKASNNYTDELIFMGCKPVASPIQSVENQTYSNLQNCATVEDT